LKDPEAGSIYRAVYVGVALFFAVLFSALFIYQIRGIVLALLLTLLFAIILSAPVNYMARRGVPRGLGVVIVLGALALVFWITGVSIAPVVREQAEQLAEEFPALLAATQNFVQDVQTRFGLEVGFELNMNELMSQAQNLLSMDTLAAAAGLGVSVVTVISMALVIAIGTIYLSISPMPVVNGFVSLFPAGWRPRVREVLSRTYSTVQRWFLGQLTAMIFIGIFSAIALSIIGIQFAVLLGVFSGLISFIPFVGPVISVIPPVLLALVSGDLISAIWVIVAYTAIQQIESNILQPVVMSRAVALHPAVVLFAILIMGTLFGLVGLLLAVPLVAAIQVLVQELWVRRMDEMGEDPDSPPPPGGKDRTKLRKPLARLRRAAAGLLSSGSSGRRENRSGPRRERTPHPPE
jgi:predicted PurR-regulated permease PerM